MKKAVVFGTMLLLVFGDFIFAGCPPYDLNGDCFVDYEDFAEMGGQWLNGYDSNDVADMASEWLMECIREPNGIVWVSIDDPGVPGHTSFNGQMSKYETTNAQYCEFLNTSLASGDVTVSDNNSIGDSGSNPGTDYVGQVYYDGDGPGFTWDGATNGGAARINYSGGIFSVDSGFEHHPVTYVSWYGAKAFCNYYGYRLPTEWEWEAVADYDGNFIYGCGMTINNNIANYLGSTHLDGTTVVDSFGTYGYGMNDMAGNVQEWTDSIYQGKRVLRGGSWNLNDYYCTVLNGDPTYPDIAHYSIGFRICR